MTCVDIRDLGAPTNLGSIYSEPVSGMALAGSALVVTGPEGLKVIEAATHGTAAMLGFYPGGGFGEVALAGNQACVARGRDGLLVLELGTVGLNLRAFCVIRPSSWSWWGARQTSKWPWRAACP